MTDEVSLDIRVRLSTANLRVLVMFSAYFTSQPCRHDASLASVLAMTPMSSPTPHRQTLIAERCFCSRRSVVIKMAVFLSEIVLCSV